jgi:small subunit ribosomal protein S18
MAEQEVTEGQAKAQPPEPERRELIVRRPMRRKKRGGRRLFLRRKIDRFDADTTLAIDYKDAKMLRSFLTERGKIIPRRITGNSAKHQRELTLAIKRARHIALLPFTSQHQ